MDSFELNKIMGAVLGTCLFLLALNIGINTIASLVPIPGGGTAVSSVGLAGMLTAFGVDPAAGAAAVLAHQLAVTYIPAIPGWFATNDLIRKGML